MKPLQIFVILLRWQFVPFIGGLCMALSCAYLSITYVEPAPTPLSAVVSSPLQDNFVPIMWVFSFAGALVALRAFLRARLAARCD